MLPKSQRLKKGFESIYRAKKSVANSLLIAYVGRLKYDLAMDCKAGFVISKKVHKSAVKRNLIKRRLREIYKKHDFGKLPFKSVIFIARANIASASYLEIEKAVNVAIKALVKRYLSSVNK